jgi:hypothetical protein
MVIGKLAAAEAEHVAVEVTKLMGEAEGALSRVGNRMAHVGEHAAKHAEVIIAKWAPHQIPPIVRGPMHPIETGAKSVARKVRRLLHHQH